MNMSETSADSIGALAIYSVRDGLVWQGGIAPGDRYLGIDFTGADWDAILYRLLHCPKPEPYSEAENLTSYEERYRRRFQEHLSDFPMLSRISDLYRDVGYATYEVAALS